MAALAKVACAWLSPSVAAHVPEGTRLLWVWRERWTACSMDYNLNLCSKKTITHDSTHVMSWINREKRLSCSPPSREQENHLCRFFSVVAAEMRGIDVPMSGKEISVVQYPLFGPLLKKKTRNKKKKRKNCCSSLHKWEEKNLTVSAAFLQ